MRRYQLLIITLLLLPGLLGCQKQNNDTKVVATTLPVHEFATYICRGTEIQVERLITENVSCLHDYTLKASQMRAIENAEIIMLSGAGLEDFLEDALTSKDNLIDTSEGVSLIVSSKECDHDAHGHKHDADHDPHIWLSPENAKIMANNIHNALVKEYPNYKTQFDQNFAALAKELDALSDYAQAQLSDITSRNIVTFHDGFSYMAQAFGIGIVYTVEEESGSEASAAELIRLTRIISENNVKAIFTETNGSTNAADIIAQETGIAVYTLDMAMSENGYFEAMYHNIDTLKEALQ